jgi:Ras-related protein Rab-1A
VGNKCDMTNERQVKYESAKEFADRNQIAFLETSAKSATNVEAAFLTMARDIKNNMAAQPQVAPKSASGPVRLTGQDVNSGGGGCC